MEIQCIQSAEWQRFQTIRIAALADSPDAFGSTLAQAEQRTPEEWAQQLEDTATFIASSDGNDLGLVRGAPDHSEASKAFLVSMWVAPVARDSGVGRLLIQAVVTWAREAGFAQMLLDVADANAPAIALYERMNFRPTGERGTLPPPRTHITEHRRMLVL